MGQSGNRDKKEARTVAIVLLVLVAVLVVAVLLALPMLGEINQAHFAPGMDLKEGAIAAFLTTVVVMVVFAIAAGDGLLGELQFMLGGFFSFFVVLWLLLSWIF